MENKTIKSINIKDIITNRYQPRRKFDQEKIQELSNSIKEHGLIQPIIVREIDSNIFELIAGERRLKASKLAGITQIKSIVYNTTSKKSGVLALIENLQREDLSPIEIALSYRKLMDIYNITQKDLSSMMSLTQSNIANKLRLLKLPDNIQEAIVEKKITERHGRALLRIENKKIKQQIFNKIIDKSLNVTESEKIIDDLILKKKKTNVKIKFKGVVKENKLAINTIEQSIKTIEEFGIDIKYKKKDLEHEIHYEIVIPKNKNNKGN